MKPGDIVSDDQLYSDPPASTDASSIWFYGAHRDENHHRLYSAPIDQNFSEIVREFEVGSHGADTYGFDSQEMVNLIALKAEEIAMIVPCHVIFADAAGLKLRFHRQVTVEDIQLMDKLFPVEDMMQMGLERYISMWDGESSVLTPLLEENLFHFWWD